MTRPKNAGEILVTPARADVGLHHYTRVTSWDTDEAGRLFLYHDTTDGLELVATYNTGTWLDVIRVTSETLARFSTDGEEVVHYDDPA